MIRHGTLLLFFNLLLAVLLFPIQAQGGEGYAIDKALPHSSDYQRTLSRDVRPRVALVIGNGNYAAAPLSTVDSDAQAMAATLQRLGFDVDVQTNLSATEMKKRVEAFGRRLKHGGVGFFYFAGHSVQIKGVNYLLPVDVKPASRDIRNKALEVGWVLAKMEKARSDAGIVVLDASRSNPYGTPMGLDRMNMRNNARIAIAASLSKTAIEGSKKHSVFVEELSSALETPGLNLTLAFRKARQAMLERTAGADDLWVLSGLEADFPMISVPRTGFEMVYVSGGCFEMGDTIGDGADDERPVSEVCVSDFAIGKYEVTQGFWRQIMGYNPSYFASCGDECPVENVSWQEVQEFIVKLNEREGTSSFRLPTEAEWEYAARSGGRQEKYSGSDKATEVAWFSGNSGSRTHLVGQKQPSSLGIFDMSGNVWEWVEDWYGQYSEGRKNDPVGPAIGLGRVARGGCWGGGPGYVRTTNRLHGGSSEKNGFLGFRLAMYIDR